jgi:hypothetical protein
MNDFLSPAAVLALGATQFIYTRRFTIDAAGTLGGEPSSQGSGSIGIQGSIHFFAESLWLSYPTTIADGEAVTDDGVTRLTLQVQTGTVNAMFGNPVPLDLIGVPGRMPVSNATAVSGGDVLPGQPPHIEGFPFKYFLNQGSSLTHLFANSSDAPAVVDVAWRGWNIPVHVCPDAETFARIVAACQDAPATR